MEKFQKIRYLSYIYEKRKYKESVDNEHLHGILTMQNAQPGIIFFSLTHPGNIFFSSTQSNTKFCYCTPKLLLQIIQ